MYLGKILFFSYWLFIGYQP